MPDGRFKSRRMGVGRVVAQVAEADAHVADDGSGDGDGDGDAEDGVSDGEGNQVTAAEKGEAGHESPE